MSEPLSVDQTDEPDIYDYACGLRAISPAKVQKIVERNKYLLTALREIALNPCRCPQGGPAWGHSGFLCAACTAEAALRRTDNEEGRRS